MEYNGRSIESIVRWINKTIDDIDGEILHLSSVVGWFNRPLHDDQIDKLEIERNAYSVIREMLVGDIRIPPCPRTHCESLMQPKRRRDRLVESIFNLKRRVEKLELNQHPESDNDQTA